MKIFGLDTNYIDMGQGEVLLLLHGWGGSSTSMLGLANDLSSKYRVIVLDLWGFGSSQPPCGWGIYEYADAVYRFLVAIGIDKVSLIGHSFGGRLGIILASRYPQIINKLVLIDSAGIKPRFSLIKYLKIKRFKRLKKRVDQGLESSDILRSYGSRDYLELDENMRKVFVKVVNQHLEDLLSTINVPTLILWGKKDTETPLYMAKVLHKNIKSSKLVLLNGGHYCYLTAKTHALENIYNFLEGE